MFRRPFDPALLAVRVKTLSDKVMLDQRWECAGPGQIAGISAVAIPVDLLQSRHLILLATPLDMPRTNGFRAEHSASLSFGPGTFT